jgi:hypothetical protein
MFLQLRGRSHGEEIGGPHDAFVSVLLLSKAVVAIVTMIVNNVLSTIDYDTGSPWFTPGTFRKAALFYRLWDIIFAPGASVISPSARLALM